MNKYRNAGFVLLAVALTIVGCVRQASQETTGAAGTTESTIDGSVYLLDSEPEGARDVIAAREEAGHDEEILVVGRIGGSASPWVEGRAAFWLVDQSLKACSDVEGDDCPVPWDYCCETEKLPSATTLVKVVDADGKLVAEDARKLLDLSELQTVVVRGKAVRDDAGNLTILANGLFVKS